MRARVALNQKKVFHDLVTGGEDEQFDGEHHALAAQVVSNILLLLNTQKPIPLMCVFLSDRIRSSSRCLLVSWRLER